MDYNKLAHCTLHVPIRGVHKLLCILMSILSPLKPSKANTFATMNLWTSILNFCIGVGSANPLESPGLHRFGNSRSMEGSCDHVIDWNFSKNPLHVTWSGFSLASFRQLPRLCYFRSFRSTRTWTAHQYRKHSVLPCSSTLKYVWPARYRTRFDLAGQAVSERYHVEVRESKTTNQTHSTIEADIDT